MPGWANGPAAASTSSWERQIAGAMEMSRRWRVITTASAKARVISTESPTPSPKLAPGPPTIRPTPPSAMTIATAVLFDTDSCSAAHPISAAAIGATACMKSTFATVVWLSATMNDPDATAVQTATTSSARPISVNDATTPRPPENATKAKSASVANTARPATCVAVLTVSSRCRTPALDQASAASATYTWPRRRMSRASITAAEVTHGVNHLGLAA